MKRDGIASWTLLIQSENKISKNSQLEGKVNELILTFYSTVQPCFNEPSYITKFLAQVILLENIWKRNFIWQNLVMANIFIFSPLTLHYT